MEGSLEGYTLIHGGDRDGTDNLPVIFYNR